MGSRSVQATRTNMPTILEPNAILGSSEEPLTVGVRSEYRRCCLYLAVGFTLVTALAAVLPPQRAPWPMGFILGPCVLLWWYAQSWRLRIDRTGLARRRLGVWSTWTWRQFADGTVQASDSPLAFRCPSRPWWDRWLHLEFVDADVAEQVARVCSSLMPAPAATDPGEAVPVPAEVVIGFGFFRQLRMTAQGIELKDRRETRQLAWQAVSTIRLIRGLVQSTVVNRLELRFQDGSEVHGAVNSVVIDGEPIRKISKRRLDWSRRISSLVPADCWQIFQTFGELQSRADGEFRLAYWQKKLTAVRRWQPWLPLALLAAGCYVFAPKLIACWNAQFFPPWWKAVAMACLAVAMLFHAAMVWALLYYLAHAFAATIRRTEQAMERLAAEDDAAESA
jgi:hypothetical protein